MQHSRLIILLWLALVGTIGCEPSPATTPSPRSADAVFAEWRSIAEQDKRQRVAEEPIRDKHLIGMTREQVLAALGEPSLRNLPGYGDPKYIVGQSGIDDMWLCVYIEDGKVIRTMLRSD